MYKKIWALLLIMLCLAGCAKQDTILIEQIDQTDANQVILLLGQNNIVANKVLQKNGGYTIFINKKDQLNALNILFSKGELKEKFDSLGEIFKKDSFISSPTEEYARLQYALSQEISSMLFELNGVTEVKVAVSLPTPNDNLWQTDSVKPSVAVVIKYRQGERVDLYTNRIKNLVSKAVPGVTPDQVDILTVVQQNVQNY